MQIDLEHPLGLLHNPRKQHKAFGWADDPIHGECVHHPTPVLGRPVAVEFLHVDVCVDQLQFEELKGRLHFLLLDHLRNVRVTVQRSHDLVQALDARERRLTVFLLLRAGLSASRLSARSRPHRLHMSVSVSSRHDQETSWIEVSPERRLDRIVLDAETRQVVQEGRWRLLSVSAALGLNGLQEVLQLPGLFPSFFLRTLGKPCGVVAANP
mmetsp:Transcript_25559/g.74580  ORF Transcript_25559/g.74580 Transcript_25559/m.74580 type:complete len:211 (+) Transcript_25559:1076-1708(+)